MPEPAALPATYDGDWPMFRDDLERSGFAEGSSVGALVEVLWGMPTFSTTEYGAVKGSPLIAGDVVYIGAYAGTLHAIERMTGLGSHIYVTTRKGGLWALATHAMPASD